jgi:hypothetical protein
VDYGRPYGSCKRFELSLDLALRSASTWKP